MTINLSNGDIQFICELLDDYINYSKDGSVVLVQDLYDKLTKSVDGE
jgi:hypothetical protein